jgi:uncharacterized protein (TIGR00661 family)
LENLRKKILVAPLNWGLGHATRCIPIIKALEENGFTPIIASDGIALQMLRKEFPKLQTLELPSYHIEYPKNGAFFKWKLFANSPKMIMAIIREKKIIKKWIAEFNITGIISDNRLGVHSKKVPSVFITHQLNVLTGDSTWITSKLHQIIIKRYDECWVPDTAVLGIQNLSGKLGHLNSTTLNIKYIGPLSRLKKEIVPEKYQLMVLLSGPEPQRTLLEDLLNIEVMYFDGKVVFIKGIIETEQKTEIFRNITYYNYMTSAELELTINESKMVLCRSGYTTIMDLAQLGKKAFFIPTPGQYEQEYLAKKLKKEGLVPFSKQKKFEIEKLQEVDLYKGLQPLHSEINWGNLFLIFQKK